MSAVGAWVVVAAACLLPVGVSAAPAGVPGHTAPTPVPHERHPIRHQDETAFRQAKLAADTRAAGAPSGAPRVLAPSVNGGVFNGNNFTGISGDGTHSPSDSTGDASATQQVEMVNSAFAVYPNPCGPACGPGSGGPLYNLVGASPADCVFDPQVSWDQQWGHWVFAMAVQSATGGCRQGQPITSDRLVVGWTYTGDANDFVKSNVCWLNIDTSSNFDDYPKLGHDDGSLVVGANAFGNFGLGSFLDAAVWVIPKPSGVSATNGCGIGGPRFFRTSLGSSVYTPVPAVMTDSSAVDYIVAAQNPFGGVANNLFVWQSSVTYGVTFVGQFGVAGFAMPPDAPQPTTGTASCAGAGNCIDTLDARLTQAVGHYDPDAGAEAIWTQHAITDARVSSRSVMRWYEVLPAAGSVRQSGNVTDSNLYLFNGAIAPTVAGNEAVIAYNAVNGSANGFVSFRTQSRNRLSPLGTVSNESVLASSTVSDADFSCGASQTPPNANPCRWGDYASARPDPGNANAVWTFEMLMGSTTAWTTQVAEVTPGCTAVQLYVTSQSGPAVQFTAGAPGGGPGQITPPTGCSSPVYQFFLKSPNGTWSVPQAWSSSSVFNWDTTGYRPGTYTVDVWANQSGDSTAGAESFALTQWSIPACTSAAVISNVMSPVATGTRVTLTATATCPNPNPQFQFWLLPPNGPWTVMQLYSTKATLDWDTTGEPPGNYHFSIWTRDASSSGAFGNPPDTYDAFATYDLGLQPAPCTGMTATPTPASTASVGTLVSIGAAATGCPNARYQFWLLPPGGSWTLVQPYSAKTTHGWDTTGRAPGTYRFSVWARDASSTAPYDSFNAFDYTLTLAPCTGMSATSAPMSTTSIGTTVTITGSATGCPNPHYQFWLLPPGGSWSVVEPYSTSKTFIWNTSGAAAGTYRFSVWARDASSSGAYDVFNAFDYTLTVVPCTGITTNTSPTSPTPAGSSVTITATATGCPNAQFEFWLLPPGGTWTLVRGYTANGTLTWSPAGPGTYRFSIWARDASSSATYDVFSAFDYVVT